MRVIPRRTTHGNYWSNGTESVVVVEQARRDALVIVASNTAIGEWSGVGVERWRGGSHVTIDEEQRNGGAGRGVTDKYYLYWLWHIAIGHLLDHWTRDRADSVLFLRSLTPLGLFPAAPAGGVRGNADGPCTI